MTSTTVLMIRTAADAIAAGHDILARMATSADHPECPFCSWSTEELTSALDDFWSWEGSAHAVEVWERTPPALQLRRLAEADGRRQARTIGPQEA